MRSQRNSARLRPRARLKVAQDVTASTCGLLLQANATKHYVAFRDFSVPSCSVPYSAMSPPQPFISPNYSCTKLHGMYVAFTFQSIECMTQKDGIIFLMLGLKKWCAKDIQQPVKLRPCNAPTWCRIMAILSRRSFFCGQLDLESRGLLV